MSTDFGTVPPAPRSGKTNGLAIASLVCGLLTLPICCVPYGAYVSIVLGIVAVVLGVMALNQIKVTGEQGKGLAIAGAVIGGIMAVVLGVLMAIGAAIGPALLQNLQQQQQQLEQQQLDQQGELGAPAEDDLGAPADGEIAVEAEDAAEPAGQ